MNTKSNAKSIIESHAGEIKVRLYTPAHQGVPGQSQYLGDRNLSKKVTKAEEREYFADNPVMRVLKFFGTEKVFGSKQKAKLPVTA